MNLFLLILHILVISALSLYFLRLGKEAMIAWLSFCVVVANLFVHKQITLFGLSVTCSDALAVGYLLGTNLIQEFFGRESAKKTIWIAFSLSAAFALLAFFQIAYLPASSDHTHPHFVALLQPIPRMTLASLFSFLLVQLIDLSLFAYLRKTLNGRYMTLRVLGCGIAGHALDTVLFAYLGLYGLVSDVGDVILFSFSIKCLVLILSIPFVTLSRRVVRVA